METKCFLVHIGNLTDALDEISLTDPDRIIGSDIGLVILDMH